MKKLVMLILISIILLSSTVLATDCLSVNQYPFLDDQFSATSYIPFNESAGIIGIASLGNNTKLINIGDYGWIPGQIANAISISGGTNIDMNWTNARNSNGGRVNNSWAMAFRIYSNDTADKNWIGNQLGTTGWWLWGYQTHLWMSVTDGSAETVFNWESMEDNIASGEWHHVVVNKRASVGTTKSTDFDLYFDGEFISIGTVNSEDYKSNGSLRSTWFGNYKGVGGDFNAIFDEVLFFDRDLTASEIFTLNCTNYTEDSTPPTITEINFTSDGGAVCTHPDTCASTRDATPSFTLTLDENARCRISNSEQSYDDMTAQGSDCTGNDTTEIYCTYPTNYTISDNASFFFACVDTSSNKDVTPLDADKKANLTINRNIFGHVFDFLGQALSGIRVFVLKQFTNSTSIQYGNATTNSTGKWEVNVTESGNFTAYAYDPSNSSRDGDIDPFIEVDDGT